MFSKKRIKKIFYFSWINTFSKEIIKIEKRGYKEIIRKRDKDLHYNTKIVISE